MGHLATLAWPRVCEIQESTLRQNRSDLGWIVVVISGKQKRMIGLNWLKWPSGRAVPKSRCSSTPLEWTELRYKSFKGWSASLPSHSSCWPLVPERATATLTIGEHNMHNLSCQACFWIVPAWKLKFKLEFVLVSNRIASALAKTNRAAACAAPDKQLK